MWEQLKKTGLPALVVLLPSFLWLALSCAALQACILPLFLGGRRKDYYLASRAIFTLLHRPLVYLLEYSRSRVFLHGPDVVEVLHRIGRDQSIILVNHRGDLDWLVGLLVLDAGGGLGCCKAIIKRSLLAVPFLGFLWWCADFVCVRRSWAMDAEALGRGYQSQHAYRELGVPYALTIFPEGTRLTKDKLCKGQAFAKSRGLPVLEHLQYPRTKGVWSAVNGLHLDSVFDATVRVADGRGGGEANLVSLARAEPCEVHIHMERLAPGDIPHDQDGLERWLYGLWAIKEQRLQNFNRVGNFGSDSKCIDGASSTGTRPPYEVQVRPSAGYAMLFSVLWWLSCAAAFAWWCLRQGHVRLLGGCCLGFTMLVAALSFALHQVHFQKSPPASGSIGEEPSKAKSL